jgi:hypothetical protein
VGNVVAIGSVPRAFLSENKRMKPMNISPIMPVHADWDGHEYRSGGLAFEDYARMHTETRKVAGGRRGLDRDWVYSNTKLRMVITRAMEIRAGFRTPRPGTEAERLVAAQKAIQERVCPSLKEALARTCGRYALMKKAGASVSALEKMETLIKGMDTQLCTASRIAAITAGVIYGFFIRGEDSVAVADSLGITSENVRKIIFGLENCAGELGFCQRANLPQRKYVGRVGRKPKVREPRVQMSPEERRMQRARQFLAARARGATSEEANRFRNTPNKRARITLVVEAATLRKEGWSYARIAALKKFNYADASGVWLALKRAGLLEMTEPKKGEHKGRLADVEGIKRLRDSGHTLAAIATMFGVSESAVWMCLDRATQK